jgi:adenylate cyclase
VITSPVLESQGTLDRYTGDGLIAFWGAPLPVDDHAQRALRAAEDMLVQLQAFNRRRAEAGQPPVAMRVGIESGEAVVGDLGSSKRGAYTAVGTCINLASRLQEMARDLGEPLVVGPQAFAAGGAALRSLGHHAVRGLDEPVELHGQVKAADKAAAPIQAERA